MVEPKRLSLYRSQRNRITAPKTGVSLRPNTTAWPQRTTPRWPRTTRRPRAPSRGGSARSRGGNGPPGARTQDAGRASFGRGGHGARDPRLDRAVGRSVAPDRLASEHRGSETGLPSSGSVLTARAVRLRFASDEPSAPATAPRRRAPDGPVWVATPHERPAVFGVACADGASLGKASQGHAQQEE